MPRDLKNRPDSRIRVVVGEDSTFMRRVIVETLARDPGIEVVGTGSNGHEVLKKVAELKPDCVTLDLEMPRMDGLETLRYIMSEWPTPVVILSAHSANGARMTLNCLEYGAVDFVTKTRKGISFPAEELISKVKLAATVDAGKIRFAPTEICMKVKQAQIKPLKIECSVLIGASTGGPQALMEVIPKLPTGLPACVVIVQHMPANFTRYLAERLDSQSGMIVREAEQGDLLIPGEVLVTPGGMHIFLDERQGEPAVMLLPRNKLQKSACPSLDFAMNSFAQFFKERLLGVILTGMGRDGTEGSTAVRRAGGSIICQDKDTSMIFGMPGSVVDRGLHDDVLPIHGISGCIVDKVSELKSKDTAYEGQRL